jgi:histone deacetylase 1/2
LNIFIISSKIVDNLRSMPFAPSVQTQEVPRDFNLDDYNDGEDSEAEDADARQTRKYCMQ